MSNETNNIDFQKRADKFIQLANSLTDQDDIEKISTSLCYASARYAAFFVAVMSENKDKMTEERERAIEFFSDQFKNMLSDNLDDHIQNFDQYIQAESTDGENA